MFTGKWFPSLWSREWKKRGASGFPKKPILKVVQNHAWKNWAAENLEIIMALMWSVWVPLVTWDTLWEATKPQPQPGSTNMEMHFFKKIPGTTMDSKCGVAGNLLEARKNMLNVYKYILVNMHCIYINTKEYCFCNWLLLCSIRQLFGMSL